MPGIAGIITGMPRARAERELRTMIATLRHNSAWEFGTWSDESAGVYVGWVARKGSFDCGMPISNERGDVVLFFSGEEFPNPETRRRLGGRGVDAARLSYLARMYEEDREFPAALNGRFHGLLNDRSKGTTILFNDRYGMHRLYYHEAREGFYFAAEAKAILAVRPELKTIDPQAMGESVACGCILGNRTLFSGINLLPQAAAWTFRSGSIDRKSKYFDFRQWEQQGTSDLESYYQDLRTVFSHNLGRYFEGPGKVGVSLTGGLDTRMIMAWQNAAPGSTPCYSFGGMFRDSRDVTVARQVATVCGQSHSVIRAGGDFLPNFPHYAERAIYLTDGCVGVNHAPDLYLNEQAAEIAPIRMTGNYGGEVLRRVRAFKPVEPVAGLFAQDFLPFLGLARQTYAEVTSVHPLSFAVFRQAPWHHYGLLSLEQTQLSLRTPYLDNDLVRTVFRAPETALANQDISLRLIFDGNPSLAKIRTDLGVGGRRGFSANALQRVLEFSFKAEYAWDHGMPQWLARVDRVLSRLQLERIFLGWHKFAHFRIWYRGVLSKYVQEILLDSRSLSRAYINRDTLEEIVLGHVRGKRNYTGTIHKLLSLELIHRQFVDSAVPCEPHTAGSRAVLEQRV